jgi:hypothetical protein
VRGPVIVAFLAVTQREVDEDTSAVGLATVLDDFQYHLDNDRAQLRTAGIELVETYADTIRVLRTGLPDTLILPRRSAQRVGYLLVAPGRPMALEYGVRTDSDLWCIASWYFALATPHGCS